MDRREDAPCSEFRFAESDETPVVFVTPRPAQARKGTQFDKLQKGAVILPEEKLAAGVHILVPGGAKITCLKPAGQHVTVNLLAPGPIPQFGSHPAHQWQFRCEAHSDCRVGSVKWEQFDVVQGHVKIRFKKISREQSDGMLSLLRREPRLSRAPSADASSTMFDLGVKDSRGTLLRVFLSYKGLDGLVGTSRPRVTEYMDEFEREDLLIRQGRQTIVRLDKLQNSLSL